MLIKLIKRKVEGGLIFGFFGIVVNGFAVLKLLKGKTHNERFAMLHLLDDLLGWAVVIVVSIIMLINRQLIFLDPLFSIFISFYLLWVVIKNMKEVINIFLQSVPKNMDIARIKNILLNIKPIKEIHDVHIWSIDGDYNILSIHITLNQNSSIKEYNSIKKKVRSALIGENIQHATIEICNENEACMFKEKIL